MRKTVIRFFTIADYEEEEVWLRKQHRSGWKLVKMVPPCVYVFEDYRPEDVIYRLDYKNSKQTEEYIIPLLDVVKGVPEWNNAAWLMRYQMVTMLEAFKRLL